MYRQRTLAKQQPIAKLGEAASIGELGLSQTKYRPLLGA